MKGVEQSKTDPDMSETEKVWHTLCRLDNESKAGSQLFSQCSDWAVLKTIYRQIQNDINKAKREEKFRNMSTKQAFIK